MKLCKDCKFMEPTEQLPKCLHPVARFIDRITGKSVQYFCSAARDHSGVCGEAAVLFIPRTEAAE